MKHKAAVTQRLNRKCAYCQRQLPGSRSARAVYCNTQCRMAAMRLSRRVATAVAERIDTVASRTVDRMFPGLAPELRARAVATVRDSLRVAFTGTTERIPDDATVDQDQLLAIIDRDGEAIAAAFDQNIAASRRALQN